MKVGKPRHLLSKQAAPPPHLWHKGKQINLTAYEATKQVKKIIYYIYNKIFLILINLRNHGFPFHLNTYVKMPLLLFRHHFLP